MKIAIGRQKRAFHPGDKGWSLFLTLKREAVLAPPVIRIKRPKVPHEHTSTHKGTDVYSAEWKVVAHPYSKGGITRNVRSIALLFSWLKYTCVCLRCRSIRHGLHRHCCWPQPTCTWLIYLPLVHNTTSVVFFHEIGQVLQEFHVH